MIHHEYPFNETVRTFLRLEHLFDRLGQLVARETPLDHHYALATLFDVMDLSSRVDLKADLLQELDRQRQQLVSYRGNPSISISALDMAIRRIELAHQRLNKLPGKAGQALAANDWLMSIRSRISIPGGTCEFDLPAYFAWQQVSAEQRRADLQRWVSTLDPMAHALAVCMDLLRASGSSQVIQVRGGQYTQSLAGTRNFQLARLRLERSHELVAEISGNRLMLSLRLMRADAEYRLKPAIVDLPVELTLCA